jgi:outer membrane protein
MLSWPRVSLAAGCARSALPLVLVALAACATDRLDLAPSTPDKAWVIPPSLRPASDQGMGPHAASDDALPGNVVSIDPARRYDLPGLIDLAQRNNPETHEAWERARQAALAVGLSEAAYVPQISAEMVGGFQRTPLPVPKNLVPQGYFTADTRELLPTLTAKWLLFDFGRRAGAEQAARANSFVANVAFTGAHQKLLYSVSRDYFALGAARGRLRVANQTLKTAEVVQDAAEMRQARGLGTVVEVAQARRQTAQARFNLARAVGVEHAAYAALIASMGISPSARLEVMDSSDEKLPAGPSEDVDQFVRSALVNRPDISAALGKIRAAQAMLGGARASYYPTIGMEAQAYQNIGSLSTQGSPYYSVNQPGANILLRLSWPLFDGGMRDADVARANSEVAAARASLDQTRDVAVQQVTNAYDALSTSFAEYAAALPLTEAAQTAYSAALDAYQHGVGTYTDVISSETALSQADSEKEDAHANVLTAAAALAFATGSILAPPS